MVAGQFHQTAFDYFGRLVLAADMKILPLGTDRLYKQLQNFVEYLPIVWVVGQQNGKL